VSVTSDRGTWISPLDQAESSTSTVGEVHFLRSATDRGTLPIEEVMPDAQAKREPGEPVVAASGKRRRKRRKKKAGAGPNRFGPRPFPKDPLERALKIPIAIKEKNGGNPWPPQDVAEAVGLSHQTPGFYYLAASARDYGLTEGARDSKKIELTKLGNSLVYPANEREEAASRLEAFRSVKAFADVLAHYGGSLACACTQTGPSP
jgi:hypothetical protein